jgi:hypothetical protein
MGPGSSRCICMVKKENSKLRVQNQKNKVSGDSQLVGHCLLLVDPYSANSSRTVDMSRLKSLMTPVNQIYFFPRTCHFTVNQISF